ncbi:MAG: Hsp70 family protein [Chloroflexota bacterium]
MSDRTSTESIGIGLDFGTSNSGAAFFDGKYIIPIPLEADNPQARVAQSTLFITNEHETVIGQAAIQAFYQDHSGRPKKIEKILVGSLTQVYSDGLEVTEDVFAQVDSLAGGRLFRSLKSELTSEHASTRVFGKHLQIHELIGSVLSQVRHKAEEHLQREVTAVTLGRPVVFSGDLSQPAQERAQRRLMNAADYAGFKEIRFELEPVAAALNYGFQSRQRQKVLIFDFGGGTLDLTVALVGGSRPEEIITSGGIALGGDVLDKILVQDLLLDHFGARSTFGEQESPFPRALSQALLHWETILKLHQPSVLGYLGLVRASSNQPSRIKAFESLIINHMGVQLFKAVEDAKIELSDQQLGIIRLVADNLDIWQPVVRGQFEATIGHVLEQIETRIGEVLSSAKLGPSQIDRVVRTGGSSAIPSVISLLQRLFGEEKVIATDLFGSVAAGLALRAYQQTDERTDLL